MTTKTQNAELRKFLTPARLLVICALVAGIVAFFALRLDQFLSLEALKANREALTGWVSAHQVAAAASYIAAYILVVALSLPVGAIMTLTGGFLFGPFLGGLLAVAGATAGATVIFVGARFVFGTALRARAGPWLQRMEAGFNKNAFSYLLALRFTPVLPFWLVNLVPAFLNVRTDTFVVATLIGVLPATVVFVLIGHGLGAALDSGEPLSAALNGWVIAAMVGLALLVAAPPIIRAVRARRKPSG